MKNQTAWRPTKFIEKAGRLQASANPAHVGVRSRMVANLIASAYAEVLRKHVRHGVLLDVGCGHVPLYGIYRNLVSDVVCIDWSSSAHQSPHLDITTDLNELWPVADCSVDTVLATDVLEHLVNPSVFWRECTRVMRPGAVLIVGVPFLYWLHETPHDHHRFTEYSIRHYCESSGLIPIELQPYGGPLAVVLDLVGKNISNNRCARAFQAIAVAVLRSRIGQKMDARNRSLFPLGYCLVAYKQI